MVRIAMLVAAMAALAMSQQSVKLMPCNPTGASQFQTWDLTGPAHEIRLKEGLACLDVEDYSTDDGATVYTFAPCHPGDTDPEHQNESWNVTKGGPIIEIMSSKCLSPASSSSNTGAEVSIYTCNGQSYQTWAYNSTDSTLRHTSTGLCLDAGSPTPRTCDTEPAKSLPFCDTSLDINTRARDIVSRLTSEEKIPLFSNGAGSVPRFNIGNYQWWSEALHGVGNSPGVSFGGPAPNATSFPQVIHTGATFNKTLWHLIGSTISTEARAMNNVGRAGLSFWAPNINTIPDPRWGRAQETPGEDPYATGMYAANFVTGMQEGEDMNYIKVSSCCKHFFDYNLENWGGVDRHHFNAMSSDRDLADSYLPMFEACVRLGRGSSLMCSYNAVNGVPSCANKELMTTIARESWGFQGYITSDCGAVKDVIEAHKYYKTPAETVNGVLSAGMDVDCGGYLNDNLLDAITTGGVSNDTVNAALVNLFSVQLRLGMFDPLSKQVYTKYTTDMIDTPEHQQLALEASRQGYVLLENVDNRLPLSRSTAKNVALIGPNADATGTMQGNYNGKAPFLISPEQGIATYATQVDLQLGCKDVSCSNTIGFDAAVKAAAAADVTIVVVGIDQSQESEGHDRTSIALPGHQNDLVAAVAKASKEPIVVVVMTGGPLDLSPIRNTSNVGALVWCGYPGQSGGQAMADVLYGTYNPGGRLPYTIYPASFTSETSMFDRFMRPNATSGNPGRTYRFYTGQPVYPYGSGLSYTSFSYSNSTAALTVPRSSIDAYLASSESRHRYFREGAPTTDSIVITVKNTGSTAGADVVQCFIASPTPGLDGNPIKSLIGFERVFLAPGQSQTISFPVTPHDLTVVNAAAKRTAVSGTWTVSVHHEGKVVIPITVA